jgi:extracellular elastinolytic metalloproteinase
VLIHQKLSAVQATGAIGIIIANNAGDDLVSMIGKGSDNNIVPVFIGQSDGATLKSELANGVNVTLSTDRHRDSALNNEVIIHEYAHGVTTRLTGGPGNSGCLNADQSGGMGEGWSDWFSLALTAMPGDTATDRQTVGTFSLRQSISTGRGFRTQP